MYPRSGLIHCLHLTVRALYGDLMDALLLLPQTSPAPRPKASTAFAAAALPRLPRIHLRAATENTSAPARRVHRLPLDKLFPGEGYLRDEQRRGVSSCSARR